ncbi:hypothetical protein RvY_03086 [Ramazzottius varieornatus]|uniref:Uncharacterized protein n=1 Tax=Ramazzottius varieornatus TaxID=947166 RepID=A0A1D1UTX7_RAMVA|nr:hypothetical protein RvY_03086 [Ramazzottius varieornatus]
MDEDNGFRLTLPSDACMENYPTNNAASWTTKLGTPSTWKAATVYIDAASIILQPILGFNLNQSILTPTHEESKIYVGKD